MESSHGINGFKMSVKAFSETNSSASNGKEAPSLPNSETPSQSSPSDQSSPSILSQQQQHYWHGLVRSASADVGFETDDDKSVSINRAMSARAFQVGNSRSRDFMNVSASSRRPKDVSPRKDADEISKVKRGLGIRSILELTKLNGLSPRERNTPVVTSPAKQTDTDEWVPTKREERDFPEIQNIPLLLHVDINKTIVVSDSAMNKSVEYTIRECVSAIFWGTIKYPEVANGTNTPPGKPSAEKLPVSFNIPHSHSGVSVAASPLHAPDRDMHTGRNASSASGRPRWMWDGTKPRLRAEGDYVNYLQFCRQMLPDDKEARISSIRSFDLVQHLSCRKQMEDFVARTVKKMTIPDASRGAAAKEAGLTGDWLNVFPSFFKLIASLQQSKRTFSVLFRSFGNDVERVRIEWNSFCEGRHPLYSGLLNDIGPLDGTQEGIPDRRIHASASHMIYRDAQGPIMGLGISTNGVYEGAWDQWARSKIEEDTRDGRSFLRSVTTTIEGYEDLRKWMKDMALGEKSAAIKDDYAWWHHCGEASWAGKLMFAMSDITQVFFDDNADGGWRNDAKIIDCRCGDSLWTHTISHEIGDGSMYSQVNPIDAILNDHYFIKLLEKCEKKQLDCLAHIQHQRSSATMYQIINASPKPAHSGVHAMISKQQTSLSGGVPAVALAFRDVPVAPRPSYEMVESVQALHALLLEHGVDAAVFGTKKYKTVDLLFHELQAGKCSLESFTQNSTPRNKFSLRLVVEVVLVKMYFRDKILVETHQQMVDGGLRSRNGFLPGTKKRANETFVDCVRRWMVHEVQLNPDLLYAVDEKGLFEKYEEAAISYPLNCQYFRYTVCYKLDENFMEKNEGLMERMGLPMGTMFSTTESKPAKASGFGSHQVIHFWSWYQPALWYSSQITPVATSLPSMMQCFDKVLGGNKRRGPYQRLLLKIFQTMEMSTLTGGLSGSLVLKVQPIDMDTNRRLDPCIVKLDKADAILHEVVNSKRVYNVLSDRAAQILSNAVFFTDPETNVEYGAFKLELAAGCWKIPEVASPNVEEVLSTMRDTLLHEVESHFPTIEEFERIAVDGCAEKRPFGNVDSVIYELIGPGGMLCNMLQEGILRSEDNLLDTFFAGLEGRDSKYNPFFGEELTPGKKMRAKMARFAKIHFSELNDSGEDLPDVRASVKQLIEVWKRKRAAYLVRTRKAEKELYAPLIGLAHGDLNMRNLLVDAMDAVWLIDFAFSKDLPLCWDLAKIETSFLLEYSVLPVSPTTFLEFAGENNDEWVENKAAAWLDVSDVVAAEFLERLQLRHSLEDACHHAAMRSKCPLTTARKLRSRVCTEEEEKKVFDYVVRLTPALLEGETLPDLLSQAPKRVLDVEHPVSATCIAPLVYIVQHVMRFRRLFMDHWVHCLSKDPSIQLFRGDVLAIQLWIGLLQESHRLLGYFDIPPWHKTWVVFFIRKLIQLMRRQLEEEMLLAPCDLQSVGVEENRALTSQCEWNIVNDVAVEHLIAGKVLMRQNIATPTRKNVSSTRNFSCVRQVHWEKGLSFGSYVLDIDGNLCETHSELDDVVIICMAKGDFIRVPESGTNGRVAAVTNLKDGIYTLQYAVNIDLPATQQGHPQDWSENEFGMSIGYDPHLNNHLIVPRITYHEGTEILFFTLSGRTLSGSVQDSWGSLHLIRAVSATRQSAGSKKRSAIASVCDTEYCDYWVSLVPENHCRAALSYAVFEETLEKFRIYSKARYSSMMDAISGELIDVLGTVSFSIQRVPPIWSGTDWKNNEDKPWDCNLLYDVVMNGPATGHLIVGSLGSGKSCIIRRLIMYSLNRSKQSVPMVLNPRDMSRRAASFPQNSKTPHGIQLLSWYLQLTYGENSPRYSTLWQAMNAHRVVFFIDGLDEATEELRPALHQCLRELVALDHRVVVTTRSMEIASDVLDLFCAWEINPLEFNAKFQLVKSRLHPPQWTESDRNDCLQFASTFCSRLAPEERVRWSIPLMVSVLIVYWREKVKRKNCAPELDATLEYQTDDVSENAIRQRSSRRSANFEISPLSRDSSGSVAPPDDDKTRELNFSRVYRVALDVLLKRVHGTNQANRLAAANQVEEFKALLGRIAMHMKNESKTSFTEEDALRAQAQIFDTEDAFNVWFGLEQLIRKGDVPLLQYCSDKHTPSYCFAFSSFAEFLAKDGEERKLQYLDGLVDAHTYDGTENEVEEENLEGEGFIDYLKRSLLGFFSPEE